LADYRLQCPDANLSMIGDWNGDCAGWQFLLHDDVAATSADLLEASFA